MFLRIKDEIVIVTNRTYEQKYLPIYVIIVMNTSYNQQ